MRKSERVCVLLFAVAVGVLAVGSVRGAEESPDKPWWIGGRVFLRGAMDLKVTGGSQARDLAVHAAASSLTDPAAVGTTDAYADRTYGDGFVFMDPGTDHPATMRPGLTWYWGHQNDAQYSAAGDTLAFRASGGVRETVSLVQDDGWTGGGDENGLGFAVAIGRRIGQWGKAQFDLRGEIDVVPSVAWALSGQTYAEEILREPYDVVDTYRLSGVRPPAAPYAGTHKGPGPLLPNKPESRSLLVQGQQVFTARNRIDMDADAMLVGLRLGPQVQVNLSTGLTFQAGVTLSANYVDLDVERNERFTSDYDDGNEKTLQSWTDKASDTGWIFGAGVTAGVRMQFARGIFAGVFGSWEWMSDEVEIRVGPNTVRMDFSGYTAGGEVGVRF